MYIVDTGIILLLAAGYLPQYIKYYTLLLNIKLLSMCKQELTNCSYIIILKSALQNTWFSIFIICIVVNLQCMINSHAKLGIVILLNII